MRTTFSVTVVPEISRQEHNNRMTDIDDDPRRTLIRSMDNSGDGNDERTISSGDEYDARPQNPANQTSSNILVEKSDVGAIMGTRRINHDDRLLPQQKVIDDHKQPPMQPEMYSDAGLVKPANVKLHNTATMSIKGAEVQSQNE